MDKKRKQYNKILFIIAIVYTAITILLPTLNLISEKIKLSAKFAPPSIFLWVIIWITLLRLSRNYNVPKAQNRLLTFLVIASSIAFTGFILYCFK